MLLKLLGDKGERGLGHFLPSMINRDCHGGHTLSSHLLRDQPAKRMADNGWLHLELVNDVDIVISDLLNPFVGKDLRVLLGLFNGFWIIRPARCKRRVALLFEQLA